jgi:AsmA protein
MKWLKLLLSILSLFLVVVVVAFSAFLFFADAEQFKTVLVNEVQTKTGYQLIVDGRMSWSVFPRFAVNIDRMIIKTPDGSGYFLDARQVKVAADWLPWLRSGQKLQGKVSAERMRLMKMNIGQVQADLHWQDGVLTIDPIQAEFYEGSLTGTAKAQNFFVIPHWQWDMRMTQVQLQPLLRDVNEGDAKLTISGSADVRVQAETRGKSRAEMMNQLNGVGDFNVSNGVVEGVDLNYYIKSAEALIRRDEDLAKQISNEHRTPFSKLNGSFVINHGQVDTNNLLLTSQLFSVKAKGSVELLNRLLDLQLQVKPEQNDNIKWYVPILVAGTVSHPEVRLDTMEIQQMLAGEQIEKVKQKALDQIKKHVPGKTGDFLQHLLR